MKKLILIFAMIFTTGVSATMYFSLEEAEKKAKENPLFEIRKMTCNKETVSCLDINWDSVIGE